MTTFPGSPRLIKGALIGVDPANPVAGVVVFQYNPEQLTRKVTAQAAGARPAQGEALRLKGPPQETITLTVSVDAADQLERGDPQTLTVGLHPTLASLEMLLYPKAPLMIANEVLARIGVIEVIPPEVPLTLFVWGATRVLPVRVNELSITEEAFDPLLNPILAKVAMTLTVLSYQDLGLPTVGGALSMAHHVAKEVMATIHGLGSVAPTVGVGR